MKKEEMADRTPQESHPGAESVAQNPNPRANENLEARQQDTKENAGIEDEVGSEITDGEDA